VLSASAVEPDASRNDPASAMMNLVMIRSFD